MGEEFELDHAEAGTDDREYFRKHSAFTREMWKNLDVKAMSVYVPAKYLDYFKAATTIATGQAIVAFVENSVSMDELEPIANRRPRTGVKDTSLLELEASADGRLMARILQLKEYRVKLLQVQRAAHEAKNDGDMDTMIKSFAMEYALGYLIRGLVQMAEIEHSGLALPKEVRV